jgi:hypothetical protein
MQTAIGRNVVGYQARRLLKTAEQQSFQPDKGKEKGRKEKKRKAKKSKGRGAVEARSNNNPNNNNNNNSTCSSYKRGRS